MATYHLAFENEWKDDIQLSWTTEIYIRLPGNAPFGWPIKFSQGAGGPVIKYDTKGEERFNPVIGSKLTIPFVVPKYGAYEEYFIHRLIKNQWNEEDVYIKLKRGTTCMWQGFVLMDLDSIKDVDYPYTVELVATDGIGRLNDMEWLPNGISDDTGPSTEEYTTWADRGFAKFTEWIFYIMRYTGRINNTDTNAMWTDQSSGILRTTINWYNDQMRGDVDTYDPFHFTKGRADQFQKLDFQTQELKTGKVSEVLHHILKAWGARLIYWQDKWYIIQVKETDVVESGTFNAPVNVRSFGYKPLNGATVTNSPSYTGNTNYSRYNITLKNRTKPGKGSQKLAGGKYTHYPPLQEVKTSLVHEGSQNVFPGLQLKGGMSFFNNSGQSLATGLTPIGNPLPFLTNPFNNSTSYKFQTELFLNIINNTTNSTTPGSSQTFPYIAWQGINVGAKSPGANLWIANLVWSQTSQQMAWSDVDQQSQSGCSYNASTMVVTHNGSLTPVTGEYCFMPNNWGQWKLVGTVINSTSFYITTSFPPTTSNSGTVYLSNYRVLGIIQMQTPSINSPGTVTTPFLPRFEFDGYRDAATDYNIGLADPFYLSQATTYTQGSTPPTNTYSIATTNNLDFSNPLDPLAQAPPTWSSGVGNPFLSQIQPIGTGSSGQFSSTLTVSALSDNSKILDWGKIYWGDGPEYFSNSALQVYDQNSGDWVFSDWISKRWRRGTVSTTDPGVSFTEMLNYNILSTQSVFVWKSNFNLAQAEKGKWENDGSGSKIDFINPIARLLDVKMNDAEEDNWYVFRRGAFHLMKSEIKGEWFEIERKDPTITDPGGSADDIEPAGGQIAAGILTDIAASGIHNIARVTTGVDGTYPAASETETDPYYRTSTVTTLNITPPMCSLKSGDTVSLITPNSPVQYRLTLTSDLATDATSISFSSTEVQGDIMAGSQIFIDTPDLIQQYQRKTKGTVAGFDVDSDGLTKDGIEIIGWTDSDTMEGSDLNKKLPTAESVKAYVDSQSGEADTLQTVTDRGNTTTNLIKVDRDGVGLTIDSGTENKIAAFKSTDNKGYITIEDNDTKAYLVVEGGTSAGKFYIGQLVEGIPTSRFQVSLLNGDITVVGLVDGRNIATDGTQLDANTSLIETNLSNISTNTTNITTNATNIATNENEISANADAVGTNTTNIATNTTNIDTNAANIATNTTNIATKGSATDVSANTTSIETNTGNISTNTTNITTNTGNVATNTENVATNTENIATNTTNISGKQATISLTTEGTSGAATFTDSTLNIPQYSGGSSSASLKSVSLGITDTQTISSGGSVGSKSSYTTIIFNTAIGGVAIASPFSVNTDTGIITISNNGTYMINFSLCTTVSSTANRTLAGGMLYKQIGDEPYELTGTQVFNYDRGTQTSSGASTWGSIYEGSGSSSYILKVSEIEGDITGITLWAGFWIDGRATSGSGITTVKDGTIINIVQIAT